MGGAEEEENLMMDTHKPYLCSQGEVGFSRRHLSLQGKRQHMSPKMSAASLEQSVSRSFRRECRKSALLSRRGGERSRPRGPAPGSHACSILVSHYFVPFPTEVLSFSMKSDGIRLLLQK